MLTVILGYIFHTITWMISGGTCLISMFILRGAGWIDEDGHVKTDSFFSKILFYLFSVSGILFLIITFVILAALGQPPVFEP